MILLVVAQTHICDKIHETNIHAHKMIGEIQIKLMHYSFTGYYHWGIWVRSTQDLLVLFVTNISEHRIISK